ncbi:MAG: DUF819 family protein [Planctomycetota bacterium]
MHGSSDDDAVVGLLFLILGFVFWTSGREQGIWKKFYSVVPALLLCYFLPSLLTTFGVIDPDASKLYFVASRYLLPASLILLTLSADIPAVLRLGPKAVFMFCTGTIGIVLGGPFAVLVVSWFRPDWVGGQGPEAVWRGMTTVAGSWIGGSANQAAMKEVFEVHKDVFTSMIAVDVLAANVWTGCLLFFTGRSEFVDRRIFRADTSAIDDLKQRMTDYIASVSRVPRLNDTMVLLGIAFVGVGLSHAAADRASPWISKNAPKELVDLGLGKHFFWLVVTASTIGLVLSFTRARRMEGVGASRLGSACLYFLIATIGTHMNILAVGDRPELFLVGGIWMAFHAVLLIVVARLIKAPFFLLAVGSQANVGGAASAPVVASAFHPSLASVGVLLAVLGYIAGTYGALVCGYMMQAAAP